MDEKGATRRGFLKAAAATGAGLGITIGTGGAANAAVSCEGCSRHCESAIEGSVRIADTLRLLMYHECYRETGKARCLYKELHPAERPGSGTDFEAAARACPQGIDIPERMAAARNVLA